MMKRWIGYAFWLLMSAVLYFFENNMGTRVILIMSLLIPALPFTRQMFFACGKRARHDEPTAAPQPMAHKEEGTPDEVRAYIPGDPVRMIHWKLSAKKDEVLVRAASADSSQDAGEELHLPEHDVGRSRRRGILLLWAAFILLIAVLLLLPEARHGAQALCNRLFDASEKRNAYVYTRFRVIDTQPVALAVWLLSLICIVLTVLAFLLRCRVIPYAAMIAVTASQVYFGLTMPAWANIAFYGVLSLAFVNCCDRKALGAYALCLAAVVVVCAICFPGIDAATEEASQRVRDKLGQSQVQQLTATAEAPSGESAARHAFTQTLVTGEDRAQTNRSFRLETVDEEQISMPHWVNYAKMALLLLLTILLLVLPCFPIMLMNRRKKAAADEQKAFQSENVNDAVCAIFRQTIRWLEIAGIGAGNTLYRSWTAQLPEGMPEGYSNRFAACESVFETALYSNIQLTDEHRTAALDLLHETSQTLYRSSGWLKRLYFKLWMCMIE